MPKVQANLLAEYSCRPYRNGFTALTSIIRANARERYQHLLRQQLYHMGFGNAYTTKVSNVPTTFRVVVNNVLINITGLLSSHRVPMAITVPQCVYRRRPRSACIRHLRFLMINDETLPFISAAGAAAGGQPHAENTHKEVRIASPWPAQNTLLPCWGTAITLSEPR